MKDVFESPWHLPDRPTTGLWSTFVLGLRNDTLATSQQGSPAQSWHKHRALTSIKTSYSPEIE